jgi:hypothetical protein
MARKTQKYCKLCHKGWRGVVPNRHWYTNRPETVCCGRTSKASMPYYER